MKCEVCGEDAPFFTETYDPRMHKSRIIYLCERHQCVLFDKINDVIPETRAARAIREAMDDKPMPIVAPPKLHWDMARMKDIAKVLEWLYIGGVHIHGTNEEIEAAIRRIGGEE